MSDGPAQNIRRVTLAEAARDFLSTTRIAVVGISRETDAAANFVFRRLRACGYDVVPVALYRDEIDGVPCVRSLRDTGGHLDSAVVFTPPEATAGVVWECAATGVTHVWLHRTLGRGSVSDEAVAIAREMGMHLIPGGCPAMFCRGADLPHRCLRAVLQWIGSIPRQVDRPAPT